MNAQREGLFIREGDRTWVKVRFPFGADETETMWVRVVDEPVDGVWGGHIHSPAVDIVKWKRGDYVRFQQADDGMMEVIEDV